MKTIAEHNAEVQERHRLRNVYPRPSGVLCPKCEIGELMHTDATALMSMPPRYAVQCNHCGGKTTLSA